MYQVIIIEDDPMVASINRRYVESLPGFGVAAVFKNGGDALRYLKDSDADLIILDYYTPLMNGDEFIDQLHAMGKTPSVIMVTSASDTDIVQKLLSRGVVDYLLKPFEFGRFKTALERFSALFEKLRHTRETMGQQEIDSLLCLQGSPGASRPQLAKGLNEATLSRIREFLIENPGAGYSSEQIAEQVHLSRITIRRYMNYMVETGELKSSIDYRTGGRPSIRYQWVG